MHEWKGRRKKRGEELKQPTCVRSVPPNVTSLDQGVVVILKHRYMLEDC